MGPKSAIPSGTQNILVSRLREEFRPNKAYDFHSVSYSLDSGVLYCHIDSDGYLKVSNYDARTASHNYRSKVTYMLPN